MSTLGSSADSTGRSSLLTYENGILLLLGFSFGLVFFDRNAINYLVATIQTDLGLSATQVGMLSSGLALAWALSAYFVSAWSDVLRARKPIVLVTIIVFSLCSALSGLATSFAFLLAARVLMGVAEGPFLPVCLSIMNVESSPHRRGLNAGILQNVFAALMGTLLAGFLVPRLAALFDWRVTFFLTGVPGLICALLVWLYLREPARGPGEALEAPPRIGRSAVTMLKEHNVRVCCAISIFMVAWFLVGLTFLPVYFQNYRGFTAEQAGALVGVTGLATMICGFLVPAWSDRVGRKPAMILFCFLGVATPLAAPDRRRRRLRAMRGRRRAVPDGDGAAQSREAGAGAGSGLMRRREGALTDCASTPHLLVGKANQSKKTFIDKPACRGGATDAKSKPHRPWKKPEFSTYSSVRLVPKTAIS